MAIDFPDSPSTNDTYAVNGRTYTWNGEKWLRTKPELTSVVPTLTISSDLTVDTDTLHVDATNDRVGMGTTSPNQTLDVDGALAVRNKMVTGQSTFTQEPWHQSTIALGGYGSLGTQGSFRASLAWNYERGTDSAFHHLDINSYSSAGGIDIGNDGILFRTDATYGATAAPTARMILTPAGNVGIGTTSPAAQLQITNTGSGQLYATGDGFYIDQSASQLDTLFLRSQGPVDISSDFDGGTTNDYIRFLTDNSTERVRITQDGDVGIGTTTPDDKLHVAFTNGSAAGIVLTNSGGTVGKRGMRIGFDNDRLTFQRASDTGTWEANYVAIDQDTGRVGIGTITPGYTLDVNGALAIGNTSQIFTNWSSGSDIDGLLPGSGFGGVMYTNTSGHFAIGIRNNDTADSFSIVSGGSNSNGWTADNTFDLLVANFRADGNGSIAGTWTTSASDERLKTVTGTITEPLTKISALEGFYFTWNDVASELGLPDPDLAQVGVSAQSVLSVMPEAVRTAPISQGKALETEYYTVMYERLVPLLIEGVKAQQTQIDALTAQNAALTTRIEALEAN